MAGDVDDAPPRGRRRAEPRCEDDRPEHGAVCTHHGGGRRAGRHPRSDPSAPHDGGVGSDAEFCAHRCAGLLEPAVELVDERGEDGLREGPAPEHRDPRCRVGRHRRAVRTLTEDHRRELRRPDCARRLRHRGARRLRHGWARRPCARHHRGRCRRDRARRPRHGGHRLGVGRRVDREQIETGGRQHRWRTGWRGGVRSDRARDDRADDRGDEHHDPAGPGHDRGGQEERAEGEPDGPDDRGESDGCGGHASIPVAPGSARA